MLGLDCVSGGYVQLVWVMGWGEEANAAYAAGCIGQLQKDTIRYDTRCYFNVRSKANSLIYRTEPTTKKC